MPSPARYHAGAPGLEVGGDWYDAVRRPDGIMHLTVGDVAGRGLAAAGLMGQLRNAFRRLAYDYTSPAEIVRRLTRHVDDDEMATTVCITVDPYTRELAYASAGSPAGAAARREQGSIVRLDRGLGAASGIRPAVHRCTSRRLILPLDATLIAYTDGLVERRGTSIDAGSSCWSRLLRRRLTSTLTASPISSSTTIVSRLGADDDIALLVARFAEVPRSMEIEVPAHPAMLSSLRRRLRRGWRFGALTTTSAPTSSSPSARRATTPSSMPTRRTKARSRSSSSTTTEALRIMVEDFGAWTSGDRIDDERGRGTLDHAGADG